MLYFKLYNFYITQSVSVSNYYLCIWVNGCRIYYQLSTCNKLPQSAQMLNFLPMVTLSLSLYPKSPKSFIYHSRPSPVCFEANSKTFIIWRVALLVLDFSPPSLPILHPFFCSTPRVTLFVVDLSTSQSFLLYFAQ